MWHPSRDGGGAAAPSAPAPDLQPLHRWGLAWKFVKTLYQRPTSAAGSSLVLLFLLLVLVGPWLAPYSNTALSPARLQPPSAAHWFGTDNFGRDVFSRVLLGTSSILSLAGLGTVLAVLLGTLFGLLSGYCGGWPDEILMRTFDGLIALPALLLALLLLGTIGPASHNVLVVLVVVYTPIVARVVRSEVLGTKSKGFVEAAQLQGESTAAIVLREILPSVLPALSVEAAMRFTYAIFLVASLGFLGVGVQPPSSNWGLMVKEARDFAGLAPWTLVFPALAISLLVIAMNLMADGLKCAFQAPGGAGPLPRELARQGAAPPLPAAAHRRAGRPALVSLQDLSVSYFQVDQRLDAVREVSLEIEAGQSYGLVGESGSGKSTLALALMGYLSPNALVRRGRIVFDGQEVQGQSRAELRRLWGSKLNLVPQDPLSALNPALRVGEQLAELVRRRTGLSPDQARKRVVELLTSVQIADPRRVARGYPHQLSGGMQQRVMIAMALSTRPRLLVLDEPTTGLDVTTEAAVLDLFRELMQRHRTSALYISHDLGVVARIADRVGVLYAGELVEEAATDELYRRPLHPYTQGLLDSVPRLGQHKDRVRLSSMRGQIPSLDSLPTGCVFAPRCPLALERCFDTRPALEGPGPGRRVRCHRWPEIFQGALSAKQALPHPPEEEPHPGAPVPVLLLQGLEKHFRLPTPLSARWRGGERRAVRAVDGVDLTVFAGQTLGLVGESGSGKSTLARCVAGLLTADEGRLELEGAPLPPRLARRDLDTLRQLQMVFQNPQEALNPYLTVGQALVRALRKLGGRGRHPAQLEARRLLEWVRLGPEYMGRLPDQLSGGEKQRVAIARAFAARPALVLCDEPTSALDVSVQARILNLLTDLQRQGGSAYLFISHDLSVVSYLSDVVAVIYLGRLLEVGPTEALFAPPYHPYTEALLSSMPLLGPAGGRPARVRLRGDIPSPSQPLPGCPFASRCPRSLGSRCETEPPPWQRVGEAHRLACHIPLEELRRSQASVLPGGPR